MSDLAAQISDPAAARPRLDVAPYALLAPGQGSQKPGMLIAWLSLPGAEQSLARWSEICDLDLLRLGTTAAATELVDTATTQPLVVAAALLAVEALRAAGGLGPNTVVAGHSVGELAAAAAADVISPDDAIALAAIRGRAMADACAADHTGMAAVLGGTPDEVLTRITELDLIPANHNAPGHLVVAGRTTALTDLSANRPPNTKVVILPVAGAFHTNFMTPARETVTRAIANLIPHNPTRPLLSNRDGRPVTSGTDALTKIASQITRPVRWDLCTATLRHSLLTTTLELPPAGVLTAISKRELPHLPHHPLRTPETLTTALNTLTHN
ncbi:ACP S-malonyltransferase [Nocardia concava]|uniref:ACP S-malonyltransferase n=1 Tax=Nocardia concava TaxID=257281 RepID=UPI000310116B|nr:ACP S-malonyltransferase [Nocardia concava]